jgi:hypothetical protein
MIRMDTLYQSRHDKEQEKHHNLILERFRMGRCSMIGNA